MANEYGIMIEQKADGTFALTTKGDPTIVECLALCQLGEMELKYAFAAMKERAYQKENERAKSKAE